MSANIPDATSKSLLLSCLTPREHEVMPHIAQGTPNKLIAHEFGISQRTIEAHRARIFRKLNVRNAVELLRFLMDNRIALNSKHQQN